MAGVGGTGNRVADLPVVKALSRRLFDLGCDFRIDHAGRLRGAGRTYPQPAAGGDFAPPGEGRATPLLVLLQQGADTTAAQERTTADPIHPAEILDAGGRRGKAGLGSGVDGELYS